MVFTVYLLIILRLASIRHDIARLVAVVEGLDVVLGESVDSLGDDAALVGAYLYLVCHVEVALGYGVHVLVPFVVGVVVLVDETGGIDVSAPLRIIVRPERAGIGILNQLHEETVQCVQIVRILARVTARHASAVLGVVEGAAYGKLYPVGSSAVQVAFHAVSLYGDDIALAIEVFYLVYVATAALGEFLYLVLIEAHHHIVVVCIELASLACSLECQDYAFGTRLGVACFLCFYLDLVYIVDGDVEGVLAVALHVIVVHVGSAVAQVYVICYIGGALVAAFGVGIATVQHEVCALFGGIGEYLWGALAVIFALVPCRAHGSADGILGLLQVLGQVKLHIVPCYVAGIGVGIRHVAGSSRQVLYVYLITADGRGVVVFLAYQRTEVGNVHDAVVVERKGSSCCSTVVYPDFCHDATQFDVCVFAGGGGGEGECAVALDVDEVAVVDGTAHQEGTADVDGVIVAGEGKRLQFVEGEVGVFAVLCFGFIQIHGQFTLFYRSVAGGEGVETRVDVGYGIDVAGTRLGLDIFDRRTV